MERPTARALVELFQAGEDALPELFAAGFVALWRSLVKQQYRLLVAQTGVRVSFVAGDPFAGPQARERMFDAIGRLRCLPVSIEQNSNRLNGHAGNLRFRAAHDLSHWLCEREHASAGGAGCDFSLAGETRVMRWQSRSLLAILRAQGGYTPALAALIERVAFSEIVLRVAVYCHDPGYFNDKVVLAPLHTVQAWCDGPLSDG